MEEWKEGISITVKADMWLCGGCSPNILITITRTINGRIFISENNGWKQREIFPAPIFLKKDFSKKEYFFSVKMKDGTTYYFFEKKATRRPMEFFFTFEFKLLEEKRICLN